MKPSAFLHFYIKNVSKFEKDWRKGKRKEKKYFILKITKKYIINELTDDKK